MSLVLDLWEFFETHRDSGHLFCLYSGTSVPTKTNFPPANILMPPATSTGRVEDWYAISRVWKCDLSDTQPPPAPQQLRWPFVSYETHAQAQAIQAKLPSLTYILGTAPYQYSRQAQGGILVWPALVSDHVYEKFAAQVSPWHNSLRLSSFVGSPYKRVR